MANRNSATSVKSDDYIDPVIEEAIKATPAQMQQFRSSSEAVLRKRAEVPLSKLEDAVAKEIKKNPGASNTINAGEAKNV